MRVVVDSNIHLYKRVVVSLTLLIFCFAPLGTIFSPLEAVHIYSKETVSERYDVRGREILSAVRERGVKVVRFMEEVSGEIRDRGGLRSNDAEGLVRIGIVSKASGSLAGRLTGGDAAMLRIESLTGLTGSTLPVGRTGSGELVGHLRIAGRTHRVTVPVTLHRYDSRTFIVEPTQGVAISLAKLGLEAEARELMGADTLSDTVKLYFKFVLEPTM